MADKVQYIATGRRKNSIARVRLMDGSGKITINKRPFENYFPREVNRLIIMQPLELVGLVPKLDIYANCCGGGLSGQAGAVKLGISRALVKMDLNLKAAIKKAGFTEIEIKAEKPIPEEWVRSDPTVPALAENSGISQESAAAVLGSVVSITVHAVSRFKQYEGWNNPY